MEENLTASASVKVIARIQAKSLVIRFAGDSGDGIQLTGDRLAKASAIFGNDVVTLADFPAEIRAPAGTTYGVSGYQLHIGSSEAFTPGDRVDVLVVMNAAALKTNLARLKSAGLLLINSDGFSAKHLEKAGYAPGANPLGALGGYRLIDLPLSQLTREALTTAASTLGAKDQDRCKNFYALGVVCWLTSRPLEPTIIWIEEKFKGKDDFAAANIQALYAGFHAGEARELSDHVLEIQPRLNIPKGLYRYITGNAALALGLIAAADRSGRMLFFGSYPITPASDILHELSQHREFPITIFQAEDEIAAIGAAVGASFAGGLGVTSTSGPGLALKGEFIGLAVITELPLVIIDVQRSGPSTGMPTKMEQTDLLMALWGRNGESPLVVMAPASPSDCFTTAYEAARIATKYMTPVILLSDGFLANGSEAWLVPQAQDLPAFHEKALPPAADFLPYERDPVTLARPWAVPGLEGYQHRIGGLEKEDRTGQVCYDPANHALMVAQRQAKLMAVAQDIPPVEVFGPKQAAVLILGWGSTYGAIKRAVLELTGEEAAEVAHAHLRFVQPFPRDLGPVCRSYHLVLVPENNSGHLLIKLRSEFPEVHFEGLNSITGLPFETEALRQGIRHYLKRGALQ